MTSWERAWAKKLSYDAPIRPRFGVVVLNLTHKKWFKTGQTTPHICYGEIQAAILLSSLRATT